MSGNPKKYYYHIDMIRFILSVILVYFHLLNTSIIPYVSDPKYSELAKAIAVGRIEVVYFFIISGLFLYRSFQANPSRSVFEYMVDRVVRLWPVLALALVLEAVLTGTGNWQRLILDSVFLQCSGLSLEFKGILWYVSSFFFASIFLYAILRSCSQRAAGLLISLLSYFGMVLLVNYYEGRIGGRETVFYFLNMGVLRGVSFIGLGILTAMAYEKLAEMVTLAPLSAGSRRILFVLKLAAELGLLAVVYGYYVIDGDTGNSMVLVVAFVAALLAMISENDPIGNVFNRKIFGLMGKYAFSIYVMQQSSFYILQKTLWRSQALLSHVWLTLGISVAFSVGLGVAAYHLVEKPCASLYSKWYRKYKAALAAKTDN